MLRSLTIAALLLMLSPLVRAAAPNTLGYQGRLADAGGSPINANLNITFRLYDVASGGSALWTETQSNVPVDGGNLAVELGSVTPLPNAIWGRRLYLGVQVAGDGEMLPRPPLTAAPFALRAAGTMKNTIVVSAEGTPSENGAALLAAVAAISGASAGSPAVVELDAGTFDLGNARLNLPGFVTLVGRSQDATLITSSFANGTLLLSSNSHVRRLTARNTGIPPTDNDFAYGIGAADALTGGLVQNVSLEDVVGESIAAPGTLGARQGLRLCTDNSRVTRSIGRGEGGNYSFGLRSDCGNDHNSSGLFIDGLTLISSGGALGVRGAYIAGGGSWNNVKVFVESNTTAQAVYGIRVFPNSIDVGAAFLDLFVSINGNDLVSTTTTALIEGVRVENNADISFRGLNVSLQRVKAAFVAGARVFGDDTATHRVEFVDAQFGIAGVQDVAQGPGEISGFRLHGAAPALHRVTIGVQCLAGGYNLCAGIHRNYPPGPPNTATTILQTGTLLLDQVGIDVAHEDPADASAQSLGYEGVGSTRILNSSLRVQLSADDEIHSTLSLNAPDANFQVLNSVIELVSIASPNGGCAIRGIVGNLELSGNQIQGGSCAAGATLICAGNTKRGFGFLASTCP